MPMPSCLTSALVAIGQRTAHEGAESREDTVARGVRSLASKPRAFLAHDEVVGVDHVAPRCVRERATREY